MRQSLSSLGINKQNKQGGVSHCGLCHLHFKKDVKAKRRVMETQIFHHAKKKKPNLQKLPLKETKILQDIIITLL
jgi:hypothetical protein